MRVSYPPQTSRSTGARTTVVLLKIASVSWPTETVETVRFQ